MLNARGVSTQWFVFEHMPFTKHSVQGSPLCSAALSTSLTVTLPLPLNSFPLGVTCSRQGSGQGGLSCCGSRSGSGVQGSRLSYMGAPYWDSSVPQRSNISRCRWHSALHQPPLRLSQQVQHLHTKKALPGHPIFSKISKHPNPWFNRTRS